MKVNHKDLIQSDTKILLECQAFYKNLHCSKVQVNDDFFPPTREVLSDESKQHCEGLLSLKECLEASNGMATEKTPGADGLPYEFYRVFWKYIGETLTEALNFSYQTGKLAVSQRRGIFNLIPKKDADANLIKNWRPLTLLNCDNKIGPKAIANRIKTVLQELLSEDQSGFIKNRCISDNLRTLDSYIKYAESKGLPSLLLFFDVEKAFDTLELSFINQTFTAFWVWPLTVKLGWTISLHY